MTDYSEIISALRHCAEDGYDTCESCPYVTGTEQCAGLAKKAAEAIETLSAKVGDLITNSILYQYPQWISVEDRLPELHDEHFDIGEESFRYLTSDPMLVWVGNGGDFYDLAMYERDGANEGWSGNLCGGFQPNITHWMPLPEPPKEET